MSNNHRSLAAGSRVTAQRRAILDTLLKTDRHPTAEELHRVLLLRLPGLSLATVYRNLELMRQAGQVHRIASGRKGYRYDGRPEAHLHVRCASCGRIDDVPVKQLPDLVRFVRGRTSFDVAGYDLMFQGSCPDCRPGQQDSQKCRKREDTRCS